MKRLSVIFLSAVFAFALQSCEKDEPVYEEYLEYPGDLAALGFSGPVKSIWITSHNVAKGLDESYRYYLSEISQLCFDTDGNLTSKIVSDYEYSKASNTVEKTGLRKIYNYVGRDGMGRITRETIVDEIGSQLADISYAYDDDNRKCRIKYEENGAKEKTGSVRLDKYGFNGSLFPTDCEGISRLKKAKEDSLQELYVYGYDDKTTNLEYIRYESETPTSDYTLNISCDYY